MNLIGRLRHGGSVVAVLITVLLVAPMVHCGGMGENAHTGAHAQSVPAEFLTSALGDSIHVVIDASHETCGPHLAHCIVKSVRPGGTENFVALRLLALIAVVAIFSAAIYRTVAGGVRGPPVSLPAVAGQDILTRFCIARR